MLKLNIILNILIITLIVFFANALSFVGFFGILLAPLTFLVQLFFVLRLFYTNKSKNILIIWLLVLSMLCSALYFNFANISWNNADWNRVNTYLENLLGAISSMYIFILGLYILVLFFLKKQLDDDKSENFKIKESKFGLGLLVSNILIILIANIPVSHSFSIIQALSLSPFILLLPIIMLTIIVYSLFKKNRLFLKLHLLVFAISVAIVTYLGFNLSSSLDSLEFKIIIPSLLTFTILILLNGYFFANTGKKTKVI